MHSVQLQLDVSPRRDIMVRLLSIDPLGDPLPVDDIQTKKAVARLYRCVGHTFSLLATCVYLERILLIRICSTLQVLRIEPFCTFIQYLHMPHVFCFSKYGYM